MTKKTLVNFIAMLSKERYSLDFHRVGRGVLVVTLNGARHNTA